MSGVSDEQLMEAYQGGDAEAFGILYERYCGRVYGFLRRRVSDPEQVEDLFQQVFLKLHRSRRQYDSRFGVAPWIFTLCRNLVIDASRKRKVPTTPVGDRDWAAPEPDEAVAIPLDGLDGDSRAVIEMRYQQELSFAEISQRLGVTEPTARKRLSRAVQALRNLLKTGK